MPCFSNCSPPSSKKTLSMKLISCLLSLSALSRRYSAHVSAVYGIHWVSTFFILFPSGKMMYSLLFSSSAIFTSAFFSFWNAIRCLSFIIGLITCCRLSPNARKKKYLQIYIRLPLFSKSTAYIYGMIVLVHMLVFAFNDISSSVGLDGAIIAVQAAEAILDAVDKSVCLSPP